MKLSLFATNIERRKAVNVWINPTKKSDINKRGKENGQNATGVKAVIRGLE